MVNRVHNRKMGHVTLFSDVPDDVVEFGRRDTAIFNRYKKPMITFIIKLETTSSSRE